MTNGDPATAGQSAPASPKAEPMLDARDYPRWHCWEGMSGLLYASLRHRSPPVVVRGEDPVDLRDSIRRAEAGLA